MGRSARSSRTRARATAGWAETILGKSPTAIRMLKFAMNAVDDGLARQQVFGRPTRLAYGIEAVEGGISCSAA